MTKIEELLERIAVAAERIADALDEVGGIRDSMDTIGGSLQDDNGEGLAEGLRKGVTTFEG